MYLYKCRMNIVAVVVSLWSVVCVLYVLGFGCFIAHTSSYTFYRVYAGTIIAHTSKQKHITAGHPLDIAYL